jgi:alkane 1-monooxygenase
MKNRTIKNAGYLLVFAPQILLIGGTYLGFPLLSVAFYFVILPLLSSFVGRDQSPPNKNPSRLLGIYLRSIPRLYCVTWALILPWTIWILATKTMSVPDYIAFTLALWVVCSLNMAIAHELIHSRYSFDRKLGGLLNASVGYPHFAEEHLSHHAHTGHYSEGDAAVPGTSIYAYAIRRYFRSFWLAGKYETNRLKRRNKTWLSNRLIHKAMIPIMIALLYFIFAGEVGLTIYLFQVIGAAFTLQAITYLQHWGLSEKETPLMANYGFSWEDGCWMQACVTLNHVIHGQHHLNIKHPYYELNLTKGSLLLPASYPVMFIVALFPNLFTKVMKNRLASWVENYEKREMVIHNNDCAVR